jgi:hypothetical protein
MYRPVRTVVLLLSTLAVCVTTWVSYSRPLCLAGGITDRHWLALHSFDGRARVFWVRSPRDAIELAHDDSYSLPLLTVQAAPTVPPADAGRGALAGTEDEPSVLRRIQISRWRGVSPFAVRWSLTSTPNVADTAAVSVGFVRFPLWILALATLTPAAVAVYRGPTSWRHRRQRGQCTNCSYDLRGLPQPRCPECGSPVTPVQTGVAATAGRGRHSA